METRPGPSACRSLLSEGQADCPVPMMLQLLVGAVKKTKIMKRGESVRGGYDFFVCVIFFFM